MAIVVKMEKSTATISEEKPILSLLEVEMWLAVALSFQKIKSSLQKMENTWVHKKWKKKIKRLDAAKNSSKKKLNCFSDVAFKKVEVNSIELYGCVGVHEFSQSLNFNFGNDQIKFPFRFNLQNMIQVKF